MHDLAPTCALGGTEPRVDTVADVTLTENPDFALASVAARRGHETACHDQLGQMLDGAAPEAGKAVFNAPMSAFWIGPEQWMIAAPNATHETLAAHLKDRFKETASITEQSDAWVCFDMRGNGVEAVMQLCANFDVERMQTGDAQRTVIHYMGVYVLRLDPGNWLRILGPRSSAQSLHHALKTAMHAAL